MLRLIAALLFPPAVSGCANDNVVVTPVAIAPVSRALLELPEPPRCVLPARAGYQTAEVMAYATCWQTAYDGLFHRHKGLIKAVIVRQTATAKAVAAAKS